MKNRRLNICIFTHTFPRFEGDTAAPFMGELATALSQKHEVTVLAPYDPKFNVTEKRPYKVRLYKYILPSNLSRLGYSQTMKGDKSLKFETYIIAPFMYLFGLVAIVRLSRTEKFDLISTHWLVPSGFLTAISKLITGIPYTVTVPGSDVFMARKNILFKKFVQIAANSADYVISDSTHYLEELREIGGKPKHTEVIRYGVNEQKFKPEKKDKAILRKHGIKTGVPLIVAVGRLVPKKGFVYLIEALPAITKSFPDVHLLLVGDGAQKQELEKRAAQLGLTNVAFAGTINYSELSKYYNLADVFVMPSVRDEKGNIDASPVAMMEAMSCGAPVVATKFSGSGELVVDGKTGFLVQEKDDRAIAKAAIALFAKKIPKAHVRRVALANFSVGETAKKYSTIFDRIT